MKNNTEQLYVVVCTHCMLVWGKKINVQCEDLKKA